MGKIDSSYRHRLRRYACVIDLQNRQGDTESRTNRASVFVYAERIVSAYPGSVLALSMRHEQEHETLYGNVVRGYALGDVPVTARYSETFGQPGVPFLVPGLQPVQ